MADRWHLLKNLAEALEGVLLREREGLEAWVKAAAVIGIRELEQFCAGLRRDWEAVVAALTLPWSNSPVEGQINRFKLIKRQMYGRAGFVLLRARVLSRA